MMVHPWLFGTGAAAVGLPVLVHWLSRPRPVRLPFSTVRFIQEAVRQRKTVHRMRDVIILVLRGAAVLFLAWAFGRPLLGDRPLISANESGGVVRVVIADTSESMSAVTHGIRVFERSRPTVAGYLGYSSGLRANLILAGAKPRAVFEQPSSNLAALREALDQAAPRPERIDVRAAILSAAEMLSKAPGQGLRREVIIVSDFQRSNWADADFSVLPEKTQIQLESVAPAEAPPNLALLAVRSHGHPEQGGQITLDAQVGNYSPTPRHVQVEFAVAGAIYRAEGLCPPNGTATLSASGVLQAGGWQAGSAKLLNVDDALPEDNVRPFVLNVRPVSSYLLVTREPAGSVASSSYFLERALVPARRSESAQAEKVTRIRAEQIDRETVSSADLVVIDHPGKMSREAIVLLASLIQRGKPLLYVAAEPVDATNLKMLADAAGPALKMPVEFIPAAGSTRKDLRWSQIRTHLPPFSLFGDGVQAAVSPLRFAGGLGSRSIPAGLADDVLAGYGDSSAALVVTACGPGSFAVLNADLPASNLPGSPVFVPLMGELTARLLGGREQADALSCGDSVVMDLPPEAGMSAGLNIVAPEKVTELGVLADEAGGVVWRTASIGGPGVYRIQRGGTTHLAMAAAIPPLESDLRSIAATAFQAQNGGGRKIHFQASNGGEDQRDSQWVWMAVACVVCMLMELAALKLLRT